MYNVLIADDDQIIREDIKTLIDWGKLGFRLVAEANNGEEAMAVIRSSSIDLVLTDMNMPKMDGVELIREAKQFQPSLKFLVMSNYDDFDYVKDAMRYGAVDYVLKYKLDKPLLSSLLQHLNRDILREQKENEYRERLLKISEKGRDTLTLQFWLNLLEGNYTEALMANAAHELGLNISQKAYVPVSVEVNARNRGDLEGLRAELSEEPAICIPRSPNQAVFILPFDQRSFLYVQNQAYAFAQRLKSSLDEQGVPLLDIKGDVCFKAFDLSTQLGKLSRCETEAYYAGHGFVFDTASAAEFGPIDESRLEHLEQTLMNAIQAKKLSAALSALKDMFAYCRSAKPRPEFLRNFLSIFVHQLHKKLKTIGFAPPIQYTASRIVEHAGERLSVLEDIERNIEELVRSCFVAEDGREEAKTYRGEIVKAIHYIRQKYKEDISLDDISDYVGLSKSHFCKLFKQETGDNFVNYLNIIRVEEAKHLILQGETGVQHIANQVGIGNYRYFSKLFKQITGYRPMDYKQQNG